MKTLKFSLLVVSLFAVVISCKQPSSELKTSEKVDSTKVATSNIAKVTVYYFHGDRRCKTCIAVGDVAQKTVNEQFKGNSDVIFSEINIDKPENEKIAEKYQVSGSSLMIDVKGKVEDLTEFAFENAVNKPELLTKKIVEVVSAGLK
jgi:hypothetical protein